MEQNLASLFDGQICGTSKPKRKRNKRFPNETVVRNGESNKYCVEFGREISEQIDGYGYVAVYKSKVTSRYFFVFNNKAGWKVKDWRTETNHNWCAGTKKEIEWFSKTFGWNEKRYKFRTGKNISKTSEFATFEILID